MKKMTPEDRLKILERVSRLSGFDQVFSTRLGKNVSIDRIREMWELFMEELRQGRVPGAALVYSYTPFCFQRCNYCIYDAIAVADEVDLARHLARECAEMDVLAPVVDGMSFNGLFIGGGTARPSQRS